MAMRESGRFQSLAPGKHRDKEGGWAQKWHGAFHGVLDLQQILDNRLDVKQRGKEAIARTPGRDESVRLGVAVGWTKTLETESRALTESLTVWSGH